MYFIYAKHGERYYQSALRKFSIVTAVLVACTLLGHALDSCASHLGAFAGEPISIAQVSEHCTENFPANCEICTSHSDHPDDACDFVSEVAVRNSAGNLSLPDAGIVISSVAMLPATPIELILVGSLDPRAGPDFVAPFSVTLRQILPSRAPPLFV